MSVTTHIVASLLLASGGACASDPIAAANSAEPLYYVARGLTDTGILVLKQDGTFSYSIRTHLTSENGCSGTWVERAPEHLFLIGPWNRRIVVEDLAVGSFWLEGAPSIPEILGELNAFLRRHPNEADFGADLIKAIANRDITVNNSGNSAVINVAPVTVRAERISRRNIEALLSCLETHRSYDDARTIQVQKLKEGTVDFLYWVDGGPGWGEDSVADIRKAVAMRSLPPSFEAVFVRASQAEVESTMRQGHPSLRK